MQLFLIKQTKHPLISLLHFSLKHHSAHVIKSTTNNSMDNHHPPSIKNLLVLQIGQQSQNNHMNTKENKILHSSLDLTGTTEYHPHSEGIGQSEEQIKRRIKAKLDPLVIDFRTTRINHQWHEFGHDSFTSSPTYY